MTSSRGNLIILERSERLGESSNIIMVKLTVKKGFSKIDV